MAVWCLPGVTRWDETQSAANTWTLPCRPSRSWPVSGQPMCLTSLALWLLHGPSDIQVKDSNSCLFLLTIHFKIPLFLFFHKFSSWFSSVKWLTIPSPLASAIHLFPAGIPSRKRQEDLLPCHTGQEALTLTRVLHELSQVKIYLVWQSRFTERKRRRTTAQGNDQFWDSVGLILFLVHVFSWLGEGKGRDASASSCSPCKRGPFQSGDDPNPPLVKMTSKDWVCLPGLGACIAVQRDVIWKGGCANPCGQHLLPVTKRKACSARARRHPSIAVHQQSSHTQSSLISLEDLARPDIRLHELSYMSSLFTSPTAVSMLFFRLFPTSGNQYCYSILICLRNHFSHLYTQPASELLIHLERMASKPEIRWNGK